MKNYRALIRGLILQKAYHSYHPMWLLQRILKPNRGAKQVSQKDIAHFFLAVGINGSFRRDAIWVENNYINMRFDPPPRRIVMCNDF